MFSWFLISFSVGCNCKCVGSLIGCLKRMYKTSHLTKPLAQSKIFTQIEFVDGVLSCVVRRLFLGFRVRVMVRFRVLGLGFWLALRVVVAI